MPAQHVCPHRQAAPSWPLGFDSGHPWPCSGWGSETSYLASFRHSARPSTSTTATTPDSLLRYLGLPGLEERWRRPLTQDSDLDHWPATETDIIPPWLDLNRPSTSAAPSLRAARSTARGSVLTTLQTNQHMPPDNTYATTTAQAHGARRRRRRCSDYGQHLQD